MFADVELHIRPGLPIVEGERIAEAARREVERILGAGSSVLVQLRSQRPATSTIRERVATAASMEDAQAHNITVREGENGLHADLHLELAVHLIDRHRELLAAGTSLRNQLFEEGLFLEADPGIVAGKETAHGNRSH